MHFEDNQEDPPEPVLGEGEEENSAGNCQLDVDVKGERSSLWWFYPKYLLFYSAYIGHIGQFFKCHVYVPDIHVTFEKLMKNKIINFIFI